MMFDEGMALKNGERLSIQCLMQSAKRSEKDDVLHPKNYHYHKYAELIYMKKGKINAYAGEKRYIISPGDVIIMFPNEPHTYASAEGGAYSYIVVKFLPEILSTKEQRVSEFEYLMNIRNPHNSRVIKADGELGGFIESALSHYTENSYAGELLVRADIVNVCALLLSYWNNKGEIASISDGAKKENIKLLKKLMDYVEENCGRIKTHEAAKFCNFSDGYFIRFFKSVMNMSFTEYTRSVKIKEAERLLKCTDESITNIAQTLEYATSSHFIKDFKKEKNMSPGKYRQRSRNF